MEKILSKLKKSPTVILMLDYDGTLTPIISSPEKANLPKESKKLLLKISKKNKFYVAIISGRSLISIKEKIGLSNVIYAGSHGLEGNILGEKYLCPIDKKHHDAIRNILKKLRSIKNKFPGSLIENKKLTLSFHYRNIDYKKIDEFKLKVNSLLRPFIKDKLIKVLPDKKVFDISPNVNCNKGTFTRLVLNRINSKTNTKPIAVYIGDDITDETAYKALEKQITIKVGQEEKTNAKYNLASTKEVIKFLRKIDKL